MDSHRVERLSERLREELTELISYELSDPRIGDAIVTEVLVSPDKKHAQVRLHLGTEARAQANTIEALEGARGFLRRALAERMDLFRIPELHFEADTSALSGGKVEHLMKRIRRGRPRDGAGPVLEN
jgi:ribosome-binding factor A